MVSWEYQSRSSTNITQANSSSLASTDTLKIIQDLATDSRSTEKRPTQGYLLRERCNGIMGVPITFLDKYNPDQFEIVGLAPERGDFILQNKKYENAIQYNRDGTTQGGNKVNDGPVLAWRDKPQKYPYYTASNSDCYLQVLYARILIKRRIHEN